MNNNKLENLEEIVNEIQNKIELIGNTLNLIISELLFFAVKQTPSTETLAPLFSFLLKFLGAFTSIDRISTSFLRDLIEANPETIPENNLSSPVFSIRF